MIHRNLHLIALLTALCLALCITSSSSALLRVEASLSCSSDKNLIITQDGIADISDQIEILALDQCNVTITDVTVGSIEFQNSITNSNITIRNVTCTSESSPFCIKFSDTVNSDLSTSNHDFIFISNVTLGVGSSFTSSFTLLYFAQSLTIPTATFSDLYLRDFTATRTSGSQSVHGLHFQGLITCPSFSIKGVSIQNTAISASTGISVRGVYFRAEVASGSLPANYYVSQISITNISLSNITYSRQLSSLRILRGIHFRAEPNSVTNFSSVEISNISADGVDFGTTSTGDVGLVSIYVDGHIAAPVGSSSSSLSVSNLATRNVRGETPSGSGYASVHAFAVMGNPPALKYFTRVEISHLTASNVTMRQLGSGTAAVEPFFRFSANSYASSSSSSVTTTSLRIHSVVIANDIILESDDSVSVFGMSSRSITDYSLIIIENIHVADADVSLLGTGTKELTGIRILAGHSITSPGGPSSSFLIRNITVPSPASTSSSHTSYAKTTDNLFDNVNNFYNVTISQLTYLGEWTVPSNLVSSGPVVFSILDSNATSILFNDAITDSNITVSGVTCELNPSFCIKFGAAVTSASSSSDFISISDVTVRTGSNFASSFFLLFFAESLTIPTATFSNLSLRDFTASTLSGSLYVYALNFRSLQNQGVTCHSLRIENILINNATVSGVGTSGVAGIFVFAEMLSGLSSANSDSKLSITNISLSNITYYRTAAGANSRYLRVIDFRASPNSATDFSSVEITNISINGVDFGTASGGNVEQVNIYANGWISAPVGSSSSNVLISQLSTSDIFGEISSGSSSASSHSIRCTSTSNPALRYFGQVEISHVTASNVTLRQLGSQVASVWPLYFVSANSYASASASTSLHIHHVAIDGNIIAESTTSARAFAMNLRDIGNYASVIIENIYISDEDVSLVGTGSKLLVGIKVESGSSITSSGGPSSSFLIRNITVPSPASTTSAHASYAATSTNLFGNVNNFFNVTILQLSYLGEWTVPSNLVSSGPVVFSILDSNATSILLNTPISDSNITISGVTCELNPAFCIKFDGALTSLGVLAIRHIVLEASTALLTNGIWIGNNINGINDSLVIDEIIFSVILTLPATSEVPMYAVGFAYAFTTTNVHHLTVTNIAVHHSAASSTGGSGAVVGFALRECSSMKTILISNISIRNTKVTARDDLRLLAVDSEYGVSISAVASSSSPEPTSFIISNISITNCSLAKIGTGVVANLREVTGVLLQSDILGFEHVEISNVLLNDIDASKAFANKEALEISNVRINGAVLTLLSSAVVIRNFTFDSPSSGSLCSSGTANCSLIHFGPKSLADGTWNITSNSITSPYTHVISAESTSIFSKTLTMNLQDNYIDIASDILSQTTPMFSLNSSTWNLICNRWPRPVYSRFAATVQADSSNPRMNLQTCLLTPTTTQTLPPTRTVIPTSTRTASMSSSESTSITSTPSSSWSPSVLSASQSDTFPTKTFNITPSSSITHETPSLSNSKSDVLISLLLRDSISQAVQNLGIAVTGINGGASATNARKIQAVVAMADCGKEDISDDEIPPIEPDSNPLTLRIGSQRFDTYRGSIVGAFLFIFLWGILMLILAFIRTKIEYGCSLKRALRKVGMPGTLSAPGFCLLPAAVNSASAMMMRYKSPGYEEDSTMDLSIIAFGFVIGVFFPLVVLAWTIREVKRHEKLLIPTEDDDVQDDDAEETSGKKKRKKKQKDKKNENSNKKKKNDKTNKNDELKDPAWKVWFDWLTEPRYEYEKTKFSQCFGPLFDFVTVPVFVFLSFAITIAMEIAEGSSSLCSKGDRTCCYGGVMSMVVLCCLDTLLILFYKIPFLVRIDVVIIPVCSIVNVVAAALIYEMFQDSTSNERSLASGLTLKRIGNQNFDLSDEKKSSGSVVVDHTEALVILSQLAFYLALSSGLLGLLNELLGAIFEVRAAYWSGKKKKLADLMDMDDLEEELLLVADKKKKSSPLSPTKKEIKLGVVAAEQQQDQKNHQKEKNIVGGENNSNNHNDDAPQKKSTPDKQGSSGEARKNLPSSPVGGGFTPTTTTRQQQSSPSRKRKRRLVARSRELRGEIDNSVFETTAGNSNSNNNRSLLRTTTTPLPPASRPHPVRLSAEALSQLNRENGRKYMK